MSKFTDAMQEYVAAEREWSAGKDAWRAASPYSRGYDEERAAQKGWRRPVTYLRGRCAT